MELVGGPPGVAAIAGVAFLLVVLAVLHFRFRLFRRRKGRARGKTGRCRTPAASRSSRRRIIDANRKLVLMRCDDIEHLVMVGGPADVVVENDVKKVRGPGAPPAKIPGFETERRAPSLTPPAPARTFDTTRRGSSKDARAEAAGGRRASCCDDDARANRPAAARTRRRTKRRSAPCCAS